MSNVKESYADLVQVMRELGAILGPATAVQYEAPPQSGVMKEKNEKGVRNPTLEIVLDPRRSAVSDAVRDADVALQVARQALAPHAAFLRDAVARWEGSSEGSTTA